MTDFALSQKHLQMAELNYIAVVEQWRVTLSELLQAVTKSKKPEESQS